MTQGSRVLLIKRFRREPSATGCDMCGWTGIECPGHHYAVLPGGHVESGETASGAALRELEEETGLRASIARVLWNGHHNGRPATYFLMTDVAGVPVLSGPEAAENSAGNSYELRWAAADEFDALNLHPPDIRAKVAALLAS